VTAIPVTEEATVLRSGALAKAAGVNQQTLRYYERRGLLEAPHRTLGGHRVYPPAAVTVARIIKAAQRLGFTLDEIAGLMDTGRHHARSDTDLHERAASKLSEIEARIDDLTAIRDTLRAALDAGCHDLETCADSPDCPIPFTTLADAT
jgi:MerR family mercuric resistance operon transcriptional regulator